MDNFALTLKKYKDELKVTQLGMCTILFGVPHRTLQSWLQGEKLPPEYVKNLIIDRLRNIKNEVPDKSVNVE